MTEGKTCALCPFPLLMTAGVHMYEQMESGKLQDLWSNRKEGFSASVGVPLCEDHLPFATEGLILYINGELTFLGELTVMNCVGACDQEIRNTIKACGKNPENEIAKATMKVVLMMRQMSRRKLKRAHNGSNPNGIKANGGV